MGFLFAFSKNSTRACVYAYVFLQVSHGASHSRAPEDDAAFASENGTLTEVVPEDGVDIEPFNDGDVASCATVITAAPDGTNGAVVFDDDDRAPVFHKAADKAAAAATCNECVCVCLCRVCVLVCVQNRVYVCVFNPTVHKPA